MEETVKDVGEFGLIDRIAKDLIYRPELVVIGSGDDGRCIGCRPAMIR